MGARCISCGQWKSFEELDGGHFIPTTSSSIRFDERNINAQCTRCNRFLHGNPRLYLKGMLQKFGADVVNDLEAREHQSKKWTREELDDLRVYYRQKIADLHNGIAPDVSNEPLSVQALWSGLAQPDSLPGLSMSDPTLYAGD